MFDGPLERLTKTLAGLPGLGSRSARRVILHLLTQKEQKLIPLIAALEAAARDVQTCDVCGNLDTVMPCRICRDEAREQQTVCVVAGVADLWAVERTGTFKGQYHVLGGILSALDGIGPQDLRIQPLIDRIKEENMSEVILALSATVDGQSTAHYLMDMLADHPSVRVTRLAHGMPVGGELDDLDDGTIATALKSRG